MDQPPVNENTPQKVNVSEVVRSWIKDAIYIAMFIIISSGWLITSISSRQALEDTVTNNTQVMKDLRDEIRNINEFMGEQQMFNGRVKEFMDTYKQEKNSNNN